ncbi:MAG: hypothetical protein N3I35_06200, partial [Clostridia bacterium]|nr:hypothetical protein [Clostridia bacterium]
MRNLKKFLAVVVAIAVMMTAMVPAFAAETTATKTDAQIVETLKVMQGNGGVTPEYLAKDTQRVQLAIFLLRLMGKEKEAREYKIVKNFADADKVGGNAKNLLAYLYDHPEYGFVPSASGNFNPTEVAVPQQIYKVMLEVLGYKCDNEGKGDFKYADTLAFAKEKLASAAVDVTKLTNNDVAKVLVEALKSKVKAGDKTLVEKLVADKVVAEADAKSVGLISDSVAATSATVKATGVKKLTVEFNGTVDKTKATFAVAKGSIAYNVATYTWTADNKSVVLELASKIVEGEYTVTVKGVAATDLTAKVSALNEKVAKITFPSDKAVITRDNTKKITVSYKLENQYGEDITSSYAESNITVSPSRGTKDTFNDGTLVLADATTEFKADDKVAVSMLDTSSTTFATQTFSVVTGARVAEISISKLYNADSKTLDTAADFSTFYLVMSAKDQYGNNVLVDGTKSTTDVTYFNEDVAVSVSDTSIVKLATNSNANSADKYAFAKKDIDGDKLVLPLEAPTTKKAGTAVITMVSKTTGKIATFSVEVKNTAKVDTISVNAPAVAAAGTKIEVPFEAYDQNGNKITSAETLNAGFSSTPTASSTQSGKTPTVTFEQDYVKNTAKMMVDAQSITEKGSITLTFVTFTYKVVTLKFDVTEAKKPTLISGTKDFVANALKDGKTTLDFADVIVKDQYNGDFTLTDALLGVENSKSYRITVKTSDAGKVKLTGSQLRSTDGTVYAIEDDNHTVTLNGAAKGSATITVTLQVYDNVYTTGDGWSDVDGSAFTFASKIAEKEDLKTVEVAAIGKVYNYSQAAANTESEKRAQAVTVTGKTEDGTTYNVDADFVFVTPTDAKVYTTVDDKVYVCLLYTS